MAEAQVVSGRRFSFIDEGAGDALVLLHAFPLGAKMWREQISHFKSRFRVIAPDLPGHGGSEVISPSGSPMDRMGDAVAVLLEQLRIRKAVVAGCSMGGYVALAMARRYPEVVRGIVLTNSRANADPEAQRANREKTAQSLMSRGSVELEETLYPKLLGPRANDALREEVLELLRAASPVGAAAATRGMASRLDNTSWLGRFGSPVLVVHGADDAVISRAESEATAKAAKTGELLELAECGHLSPMEKPAEWNAAVEAWIRKLPRTPFGK